jgi:hypothetical protein
MAVKWMVADNGMAHADVDVADAYVAALVAAAVAMLEYRVGDDGSTADVLDTSKRLGGVVDVHTHVDAHYRVLPYAYMLADVAEVAYRGWHRNVVALLVPVLYSLADMVIQVEHLPAVKAAVAVVVLCRMWIVALMSVWQQQQMMMMQ